MTYPYFMGCLRHIRPAVPNQGLCLQRSVAFVMDRPAARLVIGVIATAETPFVHAWVEEGGKVFSPSRLEQDGKVYALPRDRYYADNGIVDPHIMLRRDVKRFAADGGLAKHFLEGEDHRFAKTFGEELLDRVGLRYRDDGVGGILPANDE